MNISSITNAISQSKNQQENPIKDKSNTFENILNNAIGELNSQQVQGYNAMADISTGKVTNLQEAVQKIEEAQLSLQLALEVKNKAINAYKEVMRMSV